MSKIVQERFGTTSEIKNYTGKQAEINVDIDDNIIVVHDGKTKGGHRLIKEDTVKKLIAESKAEYSLDGTTLTITVN